jgi:hypothetical protein
VMTQIENGDAADEPLTFICNIVVQICVICVILSSGQAPADQVESNHPSARGCSPSVP